MRVFTIKARPKTIFGVILALTGVAVILISFIGNHNGAKQAMASVDCSTTQKRVAYIKSVGYTTDGTESSKKVTIPSQFNDVYEQYNEVQRGQGFDLEAYKGKTVNIYTYNIVDYGDKDSVIVDLIVDNGVLIGADICDTSAENGFLVGLNDGKT